MSREEIHSKIDELLQQLGLHNNRLSLHDEKLSQLDIDVMRKQCIDLYDQINHLALDKSPLKTSSNESSMPEPIQKEPVVDASKEVEEPVKVEPVEVEPEPVVESQAEPAVQEKPKQAPKKVSKKEEDEMISLFEKFNSKPIDNISKAISISKRFEFQNNFFDGDAQDYKSFIEAIDQAGDRESAFEIYHDYKNRLVWDNEELKDELKSLLYRKYST